MKNIITGALMALMATGASATGVKTDGNVLVITGQFNQFMKGQFNKQFTDQITHIKIESPGGSVVDGDKMIEKLKARPDVVVEATGTCASMCAVFWLAADKHVHNEAQKIGFHFAYIKNPKYWSDMQLMNGVNGIQKRIKQLATQDVLRYLKHANNPQHLDILLEGMLKEGLMPTDMYYPPLKDLMKFEGGFVEAPTYVPAESPEGADEHP